MSGLKLIAVAAATEGAFFVNGLDIVPIARLGTVGILILAVVALWRDAGKRQDKLEAALINTAKALTELRDSNAEVSRILPDLVRVIDKCRAKQ